MYSTVSLYSFTVRNARSKKRPCHNGPDARRSRLICRVELTLIDSITRETVPGSRGNRMACQWSGRKTHAAGRKPCASRRAPSAPARNPNSGSPRRQWPCSSWQATKKNRLERTIRRRRDIAVHYTRMFSSRRSAEFARFKLCGLWLRKIKRRRVSAKRNSALLRAVIYRYQAPCPPAKERGRHRIADQSRDWVGHHLAGIPCEALT